MKTIAGVDEVGRGCLAGPVVACAVILPSDYNNPEIKDSKKLTSKKRELLFAEIEKKALGFSFGVVCSVNIDAVGIVHATKQAMHVAIAKLSMGCDMIIVDAVKLNNLSCSSIHPIKADDNYLCVAAASIMAKVYRDRLMDRLHLIYPEYGWNNNKGYGTKSHIAALVNFGHTKLHRQTFISNYV